MSAVNRKRMQFGTTVDSNLLEQFRTIADISDIPISKLTDKAFMLLIQYYSENETVPFNGSYGSHGFEGTTSTFTPSEIIVNKIGKITRDALNKRNKIVHKETAHDIKTELKVESEILNMDLDEIQNAVNIIKSFKDNFIKEDFKEILKDIDVSKASPKVFDAIEKYIRPARASAKKSPENGIISLYEENTLDNDIDLTPQINTDKLVDQS